MNATRTLAASVAVAICAFAAPALGADLGLRGGYPPPIRDVSDIPAPIPVPMANPIAEGFTYYLRLDAGWSTTGSKPSFSETGRNYGGTNFGGPAFSSVTNEVQDIGFGGFGFGAYLTPMLRGDVTVELRSARNQDIGGAYSFVQGGTINGLLRDTFSEQTTIGLVNGYIDILPRGRFSPYIGAGVGMAYHQIHRTYSARETGAVDRTVSGESNSSRAGLAAAGMAGVTYAFDHRWALDLNYRALYMQGASATVMTSLGQVSKAEVGDSWEHQVRLGLRFNIW